MKRLFFLFACTIAVIALLSACAASRLDMDYGTSYKLLKINQVLNPYAEENTEPVDGLSGIAGQNLMDRYYAGFEEKKASQQPAYTLPVGGITSGQ